MTKLNYEHFVTSETRPAGKIVLPVFDSPMYFLMKVDVVEKIYATFDKLEDLGVQTSDLFIYSVNHFSCDNAICMIKDPIKFCKLADLAGIESYKYEVIVSDKLDAKHAECGGGIYQNYFNCILYED